MAILAEIAVGADAAAWRDVGFSVADDDTAVVGSVRLRFQAGDASGVTGWGLVPLGPDVPSDVEGLRTWTVDEPPLPASPDTHPLGVVRIDHVVVLTPDLDATVGAVEKAFGIAVRRRREGPSGSGVPVQQAFFRLGEAILELVAAPSTESVHFMGLAFEVVSLDAALAWLGADRLREPKDAVQPGRRIAAIRSEAGLGMPVALMDTPAR